MELSMRNLRSVRGFLFDIRQKWYDIGIELDIDVAQLDIIKDQSDDPSICLLRVIQLWLRSIDPPPTWRSLAEALKSKPVNEVAMAEEALRREESQPLSLKSQQDVSVSEVSLSNEVSSPAATNDNFPFLIMTRMTQDEKSTLIAKLEEESKAISFKFGRLLIAVGQALEKSATTVQLMLFLEGCGVKQLAGSADTITEVMTKISQQNYWSFFNYELLESITRTLCKSGDILAQLDTYKSDFEVYCRRRLFQVPAIVFRDATPNSDSLLKFYMKVDENFRVSANDIKNIQHVISKILDAHPLYLIDVREGCVELTFGCFEKAENLFSTERQEAIRAKFAQLEVVKVHCGELKIEPHTEEDLNNTEAAEKEDSEEPNTTLFLIPDSENAGQISEDEEPMVLSDKLESTNNITVMLGFVHKCCGGGIPQRARYRISPSKGRKPPKSCWIADSENAGQISDQEMQDYTVHSNRQEEPKPELTAKSFDSI